MEQNKVVGAFKKEIANDLHFQIMNENDIKNTLRDASIRPTRKNVAIFEILSTSKQPLDAYSIFEKVTKCAAMDLATVYRNLTKFRDADVVKSIQSEEGVTFYEVAEKEHHPHFHCDECGKYYCQPELSHEIMHSLLASRSVFSLKNINITMNGLCIQCGVDSE